jgi:photosystem II stability/assembly factor-like uncharacterized protein
VRLDTPLSGLRQIVPILVVFLFQGEGAVVALNWPAPAASLVGRLSCSEHPPSPSLWIDLHLVPPSLPSGFTLGRFFINRLTLDPSSPGRIWATTSYGLLRSDDGGGTWQPIFVGDFGASTVAIDPRFPSRVIASGGDYVFTSVDGGNTWGRGTYIHEVRAIAFDPGVPSTVYAGSDWIQLTMSRSDPGGVYSSSDDGETWKEPDPEFQPFEVWDLLVTVKGTLIAATQAGVFRSTDQGRSWEQGVGTGFFASGVAVTPGGGSLLVSTASNGFFDETTLGTVLRSTDEGRRFEPVFVGAGGLTSIVIDPFAPQNIYAGTSGGVVHSSDGGSSWSVLDSSLSGIVRTLAVDSRTGSVFAGTYSGGIFKLPMSRSRVGDCRTPHVVSPRP